MQIDIRVMELLSSKICHDLVSPVSAINNGVELIEDIGGSVVEEAMKLIGNSAGHASRRLRLFRMAYGRAGSEESLAVKDVRQTAEQYLSVGKTMLNWPEDQPPVALAERRGFLKALLNVLILSEEILPYGGVVTIRSSFQDGHPECRVEIVGRSAQLSDSYRAAIEATVAVEDLTPRTIQAYITGQFAQGFDLQLNFEQTVPDRLDIILSGKKVVQAETVPTDSGTGIAATASTDAA